MQKVLYLAAAIVLLAGAGVAAIYLSSLPDPTPAAAPPPLALEPATPPASPPGAPDLSRFQGSKGTPPAPMAYAPAPPPPPPESWEAVPLSSPRSMGPVGAALRLALEETAPQLAACLRAAPSTSPRGAAVSAAAGDDEAADGSSEPALVLHVEALAGQLRVVDAPVLAWGGMSEGSAACAQQLLKGRTFPAVAAKAGARYRVVQPIAR